MPEELDMLVSSYDNYASCGASEWSSAVLLVRALLAAYFRYVTCAVFTQDRGGGGSMPKKLDMRVSSYDNYASCGAFEWSSGVLSVPVLRDI